MFIIPPPGLASSFPQDQNFSKGVSFSNKIFPEIAPQKNLSAFFHHVDHQTKSSGCVFDINLHQFDYHLRSQRLDKPSRNSRHFALLLVMRIVIICSVKAPFAN